MSNPLEGMPPLEPEEKIEEPTTPPPDDAEAVEEADPPSAAADAPDTPAAAPLEQPATEPVAATTPAEPAPVVAAVDPRDEYRRRLDDEYRQLTAEINTLRAKPDYDPYEDGKKFTELVIKRGDLQDQRIEAAAEYGKVEAMWSQQVQKHGLPRNELEKVWQSAWQQALSRPGYGAGDARTIGAAEILYEQAVDAMKAKPAQKPPAPPAPQRTITPTGGKVLPASQNRHTPPPPKKKSAADEVYEKMGPLSNWTF